ncbi:MAG: GntR family transcriptional regulator [Anaerolineaceae bacterium]|jgi:DNA-binding GntR family transcriptional regulator|nr:MAG: GntR family transcriptional regulator [Anaerolineaceae bacterium]
MKSIEKELTHKPLKEEIYDALHRQIIAGKYGPGDWLRQEDIAGQMGVSMTPVREALDLLVAKGIAERVPYRGVRVREMSAKDIVEAYGMRLILEAMIARDAALNITPEQIGKIEAIMEEMNRHVELNEMPQERQLSREFHAAIAEASGNDLLIKLYAIVANAFPDWLLYEALFRNPELVGGSIAQTHDEHAAILEALRNGDSDLAVQASIEHVMDSGKWLEDYLNIPAKLLREKEKQVTHLIKKSK